MRTLLLPTVFLCSSAAWAQQGVVSLGGEATGAGGSLSYSVGQVGYAAVQGTGGTSGAGVQQPYEYLVLALENVDPDPTVQVAPNPTMDGVELTFETLPDPGAEYSVLDAAGQVVRTATITGATMHVPLDDLPPAVYLLRITGSSPRTFQLIKQ
jgi:hypothetical protein